MPIGAAVASVVNDLWRFHVREITDVNTDINFPLFTDLNFPVLALREANGFDLKIRFNHPWREYPDTTSLQKIKSRALLERHFHVFP
jgi:hypothetical protein